MYPGVLSRRDKLINNKSLKIKVHYIFGEKNVFINVIFKYLFLIGILCLFNEQDSGD